MTAKQLCFLVTSGEANPLGLSDSDRRFFIIDTDEFIRGYRDEMAYDWKTAPLKSKDEILSDIKFFITVEQGLAETQHGKAFFVRDADELPFYGQSGPPLRVPIPHRMAQFESSETPRAIAKARAVAIFGPKRGRWK